MAVLTGGSQYIYHGEELPHNNPIEKHSETRSDEKWNLSFIQSHTFNVLFRAMWAEAVQKLQPIEKLERDVFIYILCKLYLRSNFETTTTTNNNNRLRLK